MCCLFSFCFVAASRDAVLFNNRQTATPTAPPPGNTAEHPGSGINHCSSQTSEISGESCLTLDTKQLWLGSVLHLVDTLRMPSDSYAPVAPQKAERADPTYPHPLICQMGLRSTFTLCFAHPMRTLPDDPGIAQMVARAYAPSSAHARPKPLECVQPPTGRWRVSLTYFITA